MSTTRLQNGIPEGGTQGTVMGEMTPNFEFLCRKCFVLYFAKEFSSLCSCVSHR
jgi:hypothetical protein